MTFNQSANFEGKTESSELYRNPDDVAATVAAQPGDVIINEFAYDPPSGAAEYVELKNTSGTYLDIRDWKLGDSNSPSMITSDTLVLEPGGYLVLTGDTTALVNTFGDRTYIDMGSFPALNNSGDAIRLVTSSGITVDSLNYTPSWGGSDVALERRSASTSSIYPENWEDSPNNLGGTPGRPNEVSADHIPPTFDELAVINATSLQLTFSERLNPDIAPILSNYNISPQQSVYSVSVDYNVVILTLAQELKSNENYQVAVENLQDMFGNTIQPTSREATYIRFSEAQPGDVIINEILYTRNDGGDPEFVELYNTSSKNFDLTDWKLGDATGPTTLDSGLQLLSGEYLVLTDSKTFADTLAKAFHVTGFPTLNDAGDAVYIQSAEGRTIDSLRYHSTWSNADKGISIERKDPKAASNDPANWQAHPDLAHFSPSRQNAAFREDEVPPEVVFSKLLSDCCIEVQFSEFIALTPDVRFTLAQQPLEIAFFDSTRGNSVKLHVPSSKVYKSDPVKTLSVLNLKDVRGNLMPASEIPLAYKMEPGSVVINEIMYNPLNDTDDDRPNQSEYVELRNTTDYAISLEGLYMHDAPDENGDIKSLIPASTFIKWIQPQGVALVYADEIVAFEESNTARYFGLKSRNPASLIRIDRGTLSLASEGDAIFLSDSTGTVIDSVYYDDSWHNPNLVDTRGIALERINPDGSGNVPSNWGSSTHAKGGTPYAENTLYQASKGGPGHMGISFSPNPFSPDNDGFDDNLLINYRLNAPDYLMKVHIYDRYGRMVRKLADGQPAGFAGSLIWDGRKDDGTRNRIGIYIVVFEAFNSAQDSNQAFKETVVLARRLN